MVKSKIIFIASLMLIFVYGVFVAHAAEQGAINGFMATSSLNETIDARSPLIIPNTYAIKLPVKSLKDSSDLYIDISIVTKSGVVQPILLSYVINSEAGTEVYRETESLILSETMRNTKRFSDFRVIGGNYNLIVTIVEPGMTPMQYKLDFIVEPRPLNITVTIPVWAFVLMITLFVSNIIYDIKKLSKRKVVITEKDYEKFKKNEQSS